jgi:hypothetical protein
MEITQKDYGYDINFTVKDAVGATVDISGTTGVKFMVVEIDSYRNIVDGACALVSGGSTGKAKYTVKDGDFPKSGNYMGSLLLQWSGKVLTTKSFFITVNRKMTV